jgi:hypothetical protein
MTVSTNDASTGPYAGNAVTTVFAYDFKIFDQSEIIVTLTSSTGTDTIQTITTHYTVSGVGDTGGGNITMVTAPAVGEQLTFTRSTIVDQQTDLQNRGSLQPEVLETQFDKIVHMIQDLNERLARTLLQSVTTTLDDLGFPSPEANKAIGWNSTGTALVNLGVGGLNTPNPTTNLAVALWSGTDGTALTQNTGITAGTSGPVWRISGTDPSLALLDTSGGDNEAVIKPTIGGSAHLTMIGNSDDGDPTGGVAFAEGTAEDRFFFAEHDSSNTRADFVFGNTSITPYMHMSTDGNTVTRMALNARAMTDAVGLPNGTTAQAPAATETGSVRWNTTLSYPTIADGAAHLPLLGGMLTGTTAQRPTTTTAMLHYNEDLDELEWYDETASDWVQGYVEVIVPLSDETTAISTTGTKYTYTIPWPCDLVDLELDLNSATTTGTFTVDVNVAGATRLSTKLTVDATETSSRTATTAAVISNAAIADAAVLTFDVDNVGDSTATGAKVTLYLRVTQ